MEEGGHNTGRREGGCVIGREEIEVTTGVYKCASVGVRCLRFVCACA